MNDLDSADVIMLYPAGGGQDTFAKLAERGKDMIFFCRHKSGPVYLWYEIIDASFVNICRSQIDIRYECDDLTLAERMPGFHWMTC